MPAIVLETAAWLEGYDGWFGNPIAKVMDGSNCVGRMNQ